MICAIGDMTNMQEVILTAGIYIKDLDTQLSHVGVHKYLFFIAKCQFGALWL